MGGGVGMAGLGGGVWGVVVEVFRRRSWWWWSLLAKIEGDPLNTQHAQNRPKPRTDESLTGGGEYSIAPDGLGFNKLMFKGRFKKETEKLVAKPSVYSYI